MHNGQWRRRGIDGLQWGLLYAALWALFAEGGWVLGLPCVLLAVLLSLGLGLRPWRLRLSALPGFVLFFLVRMVAGAWDVARRALHPRRPLAPAWLDYPLSDALAPEGRLLLSALVGLLPGTLSSGVEGGRMQMHVLDRHQPWQPTVAELERRLARLLIVREAG